MHTLKEQLTRWIDEDREQIIGLQHEHWTHGPWSGAIADGKSYGRGVADMKAGTSASVFT